MPYTEKFRDEMVRRLMGPTAVSANELGLKVGVPQPTLSKWRREALNVAAMSKPTEKRPLSVVKSPMARTAEEKLRLVGAAHGLAGEELGAFLRREGIHEAQLAQWRKAAAEGLAEGPGKRARKGTADAKRMKALEKELRRKDRALAETAALLVLKQKMEAYWEDEDVSTDEENEK